MCLAPAVALASNMDHIGHLQKGAVPWEPRHGQAPLATLSALLPGPSCQSGSHGTGSHTRLLPRAHTAWAVGQPGLINIRRPEHRLCGQGPLGVRLALRRPECLSMDAQPRSLSLRMTLPSETLGTALSPAQDSPQAKSLFQTLVILFLLLKASGPYVL